jgi:hypothetical protein
MTNNILKKWPDFTSLIKGRMEGVGHRGEHPDTPEKPMPLLLKEIEEEVCDVCGWAYFMWLKIQDTKEKIKKI